MKVEASGENVGRARETHGGEISSVRPAPQPDATWINVSPRAQLLPRRDHVLYFRRASGPVVLSLAKLHAIAGSTSVVHGHHDVALIRQVLVQAIHLLVVVEPMVVVAE